VQDDIDLDRTFKSLLKHHWMEEAQHAKLDTLMVESLAAGRSEAEVLAAFEGYLSLGLFIDKGLEQQVRLDRESLELATGRALTPGEDGEFVRVQRQANRWTYLGSGMTHPNFVATVRKLHPAAAGRLHEVAKGFM
jgi:hypothetical protein